MAPASTLPPSAASLKGNGYDQKRSQVRALPSTLSKERGPPNFVTLRFGVLLASLGRGTQGAPVLAVPEHPLRLALQLPDSLSRDSKLFAELGEGRGLLPVEA